MGSRDCSTGSGKKCPGQHPVDPGRFFKVPAGISRLDLPGIDKDSTGSL
jgi:uncharacterized membrane protein